ncbi:MAG: PAS domain S-box protein [Oscillatoriales cyanobacterium RM2_1_1]|nr:PAS domain S-box protein [Oscillatoriales cyanobacterium SM2_3_0]NJO47717.1 PAS domain S-box protein [Oscillatoriales cyanobacterium RM2_1_1]
MERKTYERLEIPEGLENTYSVWRYRIHPDQERFRHYFEQSLIGMAITSSKKGWIEVNDNLCEICGYPRAELIQLT